MILQRLNRVIVGKRAVVFGLRESLGGRLNGRLQEGNVFRIAADALIQQLHILAIRITQKLVCPIGLIGCIPMFVAVGAGDNNVPV